MSIPDNPIVVALNRRAPWMRGQGFRMHRFVVKDIDSKRAFLYGPVVYDHERGWLPDPEQTVHDRFVPTSWVKWVD